MAGIPTDYQLRRAFYEMVLHEGPNTNPAAGAFSMNPYHQFRLYNGPHSSFESILLTRSQLNSDPAVTEYDTTTFLTIPRPIVINMDAVTFPSANEMERACTIDFGLFNSDITVSHLVMYDDFNRHCWSARFGTPFNGLTGNPCIVNFTLRARRVASP